MPWDSDNRRHTEERYDPSCDELAHHDTRLPWCIEIWGADYDGWYCDESAGNKTDAIEVLEIKAETILYNRRHYPDPSDRSEKRYRAIHKTTGEVIEVCVRDNGSVALVPIRIP